MCMDFFEVEDLTMSADYRSVQTRMWREDEWFDDLEDNDMRLFWVYLFTNPSSSPAGIYRITMRTMAHEAHISYDKACEFMERFAADKKAYYNNGVLWVVNMRRLQFPGLDGSGAWQVATRMQNDINAISDDNPLKAEYFRRNGYPFIIPEIVNGKEVKRVFIEYGYPMDTRSVNKTKRNVTETITETVTEQNDPDVAAAVTAWHQAGQMLTKTIADEIQLSVDDWRELGYAHYVADAITVAAKANKLSWSYVEGILKRCRAQGTAPGGGNRGSKNGSDPVKVEQRTVVYPDGSSEMQEVQSLGR